MRPSVRDDRLNLLHGCRCDRVAVGIRRVRTGPSESVCHPLSIGHCLGGYQDRQDQVGFDHELLERGHVADASLGSEVMRALAATGQIGDGVKTTPAEHTADRMPHITRTENRYGLDSHPVCLQSSSVTIADYYQALVPVSLISGATASVDFPTGSGKL